MRTHRTSESGLAPVIIVMIGLLSATLGVTLGVIYKDQIADLVTGYTAGNSKNADGDQPSIGQSKFELTGVVSSIDTAANKIVVKTKTTTNSIKALRDNEATMSVATDVKITYPQKDEAELADVPIGAQVEIGGVISSNNLTATKIVVQQEATATGQTKFEMSATVREVRADELSVEVKTTNKLIATMKNQVITVKINTNTLIEKGDSQIALTGIQAGDRLRVAGIYKDNVLTVTSITVSNGVAGAQTNSNAATNDADKKGGVEGASTNIIEDINDQLW